MRHGIVRTGIAVVLFAVTIGVIGAQGPWRSGGASPTDGNTFTWQEVRQHTSPNDAWIVIDGTVYDISGFARHHPGGNVFDLGNDNSRAYHRAHGPSTRRISRFAIGSLRE